MQYKAEEFKPSNPVLFLNGLEVSLSLLTLHKTVKLQMLFGELPDMLISLEKNPLIIIDIIWELVIEKEFFDYKKSKFKNLIVKSGSIEMGKKLSEALDYCIFNSMPLVVNQKRRQEINKVRGAGSLNKPCYAKYYDSIAKRYGGMNLDSFYSLTLRQITAILETISDESYGELEVKASLAGKKLKPRIVYNEVSEEEDKDNEQQAEDAVARLQREYEERKKKVK